jgi:hypothetical protein
MISQKIAEKIASRFWGKMSQKHVQPQKAPFYSDRDKPRQSILYAGTEINRLYAKNMSSTSKQAA